MELSPRAKVFNAYAVVILAYMLIFGILAIPVIRGNYRFNEFTKQVSLNMTRDQVKKIADDLGYESHSLYVADKGKVENAEGYQPDEVSDIYCFRNVILYDFVSIDYDSSDRVVKIEIEDD